MTHRAQRTINVLLQWLACIVLAVLACFYIGQYRSEKLRAGEKMMDEQALPGNETQVATERTSIIPRPASLPIVGPPLAEREPIAALANTLGLILPLPPAYGLWRFTLWAAPGALLVLVGLLLPWDTAQTLLFTFVGAFASIQLVKPYQRAEKRITEILNEMEEQKRSLPQNLKSYLRFFFLQPRVISTRKDGNSFQSATNARYFAARLRFRRLSKRWDKSFGERISVVQLRPDGPYWRIDEQKLEKSRGRRRASRTLTKVGRELVRITGDPEADACVETAARRYDLKYVRRQGPRI